MNQFFDPQTGGLNQLYGWIGQVVDDSTWIGNHANSNFEHKIHLTNDIAGASRRCKVQIIGKHVEVKDIPDDQLPMAEILLPTTAGSGHGGSHQTPNIKQGMYVFGFFKDIYGTQPVIVGVLPNDPRVPLFGGNPSQNFIPRSGFKGVGRSIPASTSYVRLEGPNSLVEGKSTSPNQATICHWDQKEDGKRSFFTPKTINCEGPSGELQGFQKQLKSFLFEVKRAKRASQQFIGAASNLTSNIASLITIYTNLIAGLAKSLISKVRGYIVNRLNKELTKLYESLPPNLRANAAQTSKKVNDTIQCVFNKIITALLAIVKSLLEQAVENYVNAPLCAAESFISSLISSFLGELTSGILGALGEISGVILNVATLLFQAFDILIGVLEFLSCEPDLDCQILDEWSFWDGSSLVRQPLGSNSSISSNLLAFVGSGTAFGGGLIPGCSALPLFCGPPTLDFFGGTGTPASGNVVVGLAGQIMGVDLLTGGRYTTTTTVGLGSETAIVQTPQVNVRIVDDCGLGNGAIAVAITEKYPKENSQSSSGDEYFVSNVVIIDSGSNYLNSPDGSTGGDGALFSGKCDTIINTDVYLPGKEVKVKEGQRIYLPRKTVVEVLNNQGEVVQTLNGQGQLTELRIKQNGTILTPDCVPSDGDDVEGGDNNNQDISPTISFSVDLIEQKEGNSGKTSFDITIVRTGNLGNRSSANWKIVGSGNSPARASDFVNGEFPSGIVIFRPDEEVKTITVNVKGDLEVEKDEKFSIVFNNLVNLKLERKSRFTGVILNDDNKTGIGTTNRDSGKNNTYQVYVCIEDLAILNGGVNYSPGDVITINPNNGAKFEPIIDEFGVIREVSLIAKGCGFVDNPVITVESQTGINALLVPVYSFTRLDNTVDPFEVPPGSPVINVVDCVGKLNEFN